MTAKKARDILASLGHFAKLERTNTDEIGWIALRYCCTRAKAERMIAQAKALAEPHNPSKGDSDARPQS
jgi:hypothetical protein